jgi:hypothetical protein
MSIFRLKIRYKSLVQYIILTSAKTSPLREVIISTTLSALTDILLIIVLILAYVDGVALSFFSLSSNSALLFSNAFL